MDSVSFVTLLSPLAFFAFAAIHAKVQPKFCILLAVLAAIETGAILAGGPAMVVVTVSFACGFVCGVMLKLQRDHRNKTAGGP